MSLALALVGVGVATPAHAQEASGEGVETQLGASVTVLAPLARLTDAADGTFAELSTAAGLGGNLGVFLPGGLGGFAWGAWVPVEIGITGVDPATGFPTTETVEGVDWIAAAVGLAYSPRLRGAGSGVRPFVSAGVGLRRLAVGEETPPVNDATDVIGTLAAGVEVEVTRGLAIRFELRDAISDYESDSLGDSIVQNDLTISVGVAGRLR